jgi:hypothetical protein
MCILSFLDIFARRKAEKRPSALSGEEAPDRAEGFI